MHSCGHPPKKENKGRKIKMRNRVSTNVQPYIKPPISPVWKPSFSPDLKSPTTSRPPLLAWARVTPELAPWNRWIVPLPPLRLVLRLRVLLRARRRRVLVRRFLLLRRRLLGKCGRVWGLAIRRGWLSIARVHVCGQDGLTAILGVFKRRILQWWGVRRWWQVPLRRLVLVYTV